MSSSTDGRVRDAFRDLAASQPFEPDPALIARRARQANRRTWAARGAAGVGAAALVAVAAVTVGGTGPAHTARPATVHTAVGATQPAQAAQPNPLTQLSDVLLASQSRPAGDATLETQTETLRGKTYRSYNIYADNGRYYFSSTRAGIVAQAAGQIPSGEMAQEIARSSKDIAAYVAAAIKATTGSLAAAETAMEQAALPPGSPPSQPNQGQQQALGMTTAGMTENHVWQNSRLALIAGAGNPTVRAGVLRLISALPDVTVAHTTTNGQPTLTITATAAAAGSPGDDNAHEQIVIGADTGIPVSDAGWTVGHPDDAYTTTYQVSRVTLADVAAGKL